MTLVVETTEEIPARNVTTMEDCWQESPGAEGIVYGEIKSAPLKVELLAVVTTGLIPVRNVPSIPEMEKTLGSTGAMGTVHGNSIQHFNMKGTYSRASAG